MAETISLHTFWNIVEQKLEQATADELRAILRAMADAVPRAERAGFIARLGKRREPARTPAPTIAGEPDALLSEVRELVAEVRDVLERLDPFDDPYGDLYDEPYREPSSEPYDEPYDEMALDDGDFERRDLRRDVLEPLSSMFDRVDAAFEDGQIALARAAYDELYAVFETEADNGMHVVPQELIDVDPEASRARYLRAVYEDTPQEERVAVVYEQFRRASAWGFESPPTLDELLGASPRSLPGWLAFLDGWIAHQRHREGTHEDAWLRQAVRLARGTRGLEELAQSEGAARPRAFVDWCAALAGESQHARVIAAAQAGFDVLPDRSPIRAEIADYPVAAAAALGDARIQQRARWEALLAEPSLVRLLDLRDTAAERAGKARLMRRATERLDTIRREADARVAAAGVVDTASRPVPDVVLAHAYLLSGAWQAAHALTERYPVLGWSSGSPQGPTVACFLAGLSGKGDMLPANLAALWRAQLDICLDVPPMWLPAGPQRQVVLDRALRAYRDCFAALWASRAQCARHAHGSLEIARRRIIAIVSEKRRDSYGKAAELLVACCEHLQARGEHAQAGSLLAEIRARFYCHRAFQGEVDATLARAGA